GRARRIQRQVDVRPVGAPRRVVRDATIARAPYVSELLSIERALAVHGHSAGARSMTAPNLARGAPTALLDDVLRGLTAIPKTLPAKLFYDAAGAELFERICELDEYYLTRAELSILRAQAGEIAALAGGEC